MDAFLRRVVEQRDREQLMDDVSRMVELDALIKPIRCRGCGQTVRQSDTTYDRNQGRRKMCRRCERATINQRRETVTKKGVKSIPTTGSKLLNEHLEPLPVALSQDELLARAVSLVRLSDEERSAEYEFDKHKTAHKESLARIADERMRLEQAIREKREPRPVRVEGWAYYETGAFKEIRTDTGEVLNERALLASELQEELPL